MAYPEPSNVAPWYLRNINQALSYTQANSDLLWKLGWEELTN
jgi:hypothetical protein